MRIQWQPRINLLLEELRKAPAVLRLSYLADVEDAELVERRVDASQAADHRGLEAAMDCCYQLTIEPRGLLAPRRPAEAARRARAGGQVNAMNNRRSLLLILGCLVPALARPVPSTRQLRRAGANGTCSADQTFRAGRRTRRARHARRGDRLEVRQVAGETLETVKLRNVVPPIRFESGVAKIPPDYVDKLPRCSRACATAGTCASTSSATRTRSGCRPRSRACSGTTRACPASVPAKWPSTSRRRSACRPKRSPTNGPATRSRSPRTRPKRAARSTAASRSRSGTTRPGHDCGTKRSSSRGHQAHQGLPDGDGLQAALQEGHARRARVRNLVVPLRYEDETHGSPRSSRRRSGRRSRTCATSRT